MYLAGAAILGYAPTLTWRDFSLAFAFDVRTFQEGGMPEVVRRGRSVDVMRIMCEYEHDPEYLTKALRYYERRKLRIEATAKLMALESEMRATIAELERLR
jgi:hypothetical protein